MRDHLALLSWVGVQTQGLGDLLRKFGSVGALLSATDEDLSALGPATARAFCAARDHWPEINTDFEAVGPFDFLPLGDPRYPALLAEIPDPPPWIFVDGDSSSLSAPCISVVGTRRSSQRGERAAREISAYLAAAGYTVCSGLAMGIDAAAHHGALSGGMTAAVLASGLDRPSPVRNLPLAERIRAQGCLLSELPMGTAASKYQFPRRNRIISGLSLATIIVEATLPSGSLHTANSALEQGRDVYVLPWSVYHAPGRGCLSLLRDGAIPLLELEKLADYFPGVEMPEAPNHSGLPPIHRRILDHIGDGWTTIDSLALDLDLAPGELLATVGQLELAGLLRRVRGGYEST